MVRCWKVAGKVEKEIWITMMGGEGREEERGLQGYDRDDKKKIKNRKGGTMIEGMKVIGGIDD